MQTDWLKFCCVKKIVNPICLMRFEAEALRDNPFYVGRCYNEIGDLGISTVIIAVMRSRFMIGQLGYSNNLLCI